MRFAISIGSFQLFNFVRLNVAYARKVFGDESPIVIYDAPSPESERIHALADEYGCAYVTERANRGHFSGCQQNSVTAVAFAKSVGADIAVKLNQRFVLLDESIPNRIEEVFRNPQIDLALPGQCRPETILREKSKFHARFKVMPDCIFMRASAFDPEWMARDYENQWRTGSEKYDSYTETWWINQTEGKFKDRHVKLPWLTEHEPDRPKMYLRKVQCAESDYGNAAASIGIQVGGFKVQEWQELNAGSYRPVPRA